MVHQSWFTNVKNVTIVKCFSLIKLGNQSLVNQISFYRCHLKMILRVPIIREERNGSQSMASNPLVKSIVEARLSTLRIIVDKEMNGKTVTCSDDNSWNMLNRTVLLSRPRQNRTAEKESAQINNRFRIIDSWTVAISWFRAVEKMQTCTGLVVRPWWRNRLSSCEFVTRMKWTRSPAGLSEPDLLSLETEKRGPAQVWADGTDLLHGVHPVACAVAAQRRDIRTVFYVREAAQSPRVRPVLEQVVGLFS